MHPACSGTRGPSQNAIGQLFGTRARRMRQPYQGKRQDRRCPGHVSVPVWLIVGELAAPLSRVDKAKKAASVLTKISRVAGRPTFQHPIPLELACVAAQLTVRMLQKVGINIHKKKEETTDLFEQSILLNTLKNQA